MQVDETKSAYMFASLHSNLIQPMTSSQWKALVHKWRTLAQNKAQQGQLQTRFAVQRDAGKVKHERNSSQDIKSLLSLTWHTSSLHSWERRGGRIQISREQFAQHRHYLVWLRWKKSAWNQVVFLSLIHFRLVTLRACLTEGTAVTVFYLFLSFVSSSLWSLLLQVIWIQYWMEKKLLHIFLFGNRLLLYSSAGTANEEFLASAVDVLLRHSKEAHGTTWFKACRAALMNRNKHTQYG